MKSHLLHLMRHGAPEQQGLLLGHRDDPSTPEGIAACLQAAQGLAFEALAASDLARAQIPARELASARGLSLAVDPRWRELDFGAWDGLAPAQLPQAALAAFWRDPDHHCPPSGETWSALRARVATALGDLPSRDTMVIAHGGSMRAALSILCGFDHAQVWAFDLAYAAVVSLRVWPGAQPNGQIVGLRA